MVRQHQDQTAYWMGEGGVLHQMFGSQVQHVIKKKLDTIGFIKIRGQKDLKSMKKRVNWIENHGFFFTKCLKTVK